MNGDGGGYRQSWTSRKRVLEREDDEEQHGAERKGQGRRRELDRARHPHGDHAGAFISGEQKAEKRRGAI
jgi:hypothetical protein